MFSITPVNAQIIIVEREMNPGQRSLAGLPRINSTVMATTAHASFEISLHQVITPGEISILRPPVKSGWLPIQLSRYCPPSPPLIMRSHATITIHSKKFTCLYFFRSGKVSQLIKFFQPALCKFAPSLGCFPSTTVT